MYIIIRVERSGHHKHSYVYLNGQTRKVHADFGIPDDLDFLEADTLDIWN